MCILKISALQFHHLYFELKLMVFNLLENNEHVSTQMVHNRINNYVTWIGVFKNMQILVYSHINYHKPP